jgi:hypothetical protein
MRQPPVARSVYCPRYKLDYLITKKSFSDKVTQKSILTELCTILGDITLKHLWRIRKNQIGESSILSADDLIILAKYFNCSLDDLVVASPPDPEPSATTPEVAGIISPDPSHTS